MRYKLLGKSGLRVSELCLGTMTFGEEWGFGADKEESRRIFDAFAEAGGTFIDTANKYTNGTSEKYVGEFISADREKYVLATKYTLSMDPDDPNSAGNHRKNMVQSVEASLKRLDTDYIDLLWVHAWDPMTPVEEFMLNDRNLSIAAKTRQVAADIDRTPSQVALRWLIEQKDRGVVIPIIGARSHAQLTDNLKCLEFEMAAQHLEALDNVSKIELGFPHDFLEYEEVRSTIYGSTFSLIDKHRK